MKSYRIVMLSVLLAGVLVTTLICFYMTKPLRGITRTAKQFASGNYHKRVKEKSSDEVGQLIMTFNVMADALEQKINELALAAQRQKDFTASFAHELKTPLTSVIGYADTLRSRGLPTEQQFRAADYIFSEGRRLEAMSRALLKLFALEEQTPEFCNVSIVPLAAELERSLAYILKEKQLRLTIKMEKASLYVVPELIKTLLYNLIDNARKASKEGGEIILAGKMTEQGYRICVEDQGSGIPAHAIERITEPFYMLDKSRARAQGGAGLGLALCQKIAELHGTELSFVSTEGKGTAVTFYIKGGDL